ncbi:MAG: hypothetical protein CVU42_13080 [Chloroflexi bacterium HGW-Chloroflexi-4]|nr:MAG: hypothetical protein CVU42_13080 [Chloroflexi bacterium HGW-Chloroflexi-4]
MNKLIFKRMKNNKFIIHSNLIYLLYFLSGNNWKVIQTLTRDNFRQIIKFCYEKTRKKVLVHID